MSVDVEKICRTCLGLSGPLLSIYNDAGSGSASGCVADMLSDFTKSKPRRTDNLPEKVCLTCISEINRCYSFKMKCDNSNRTLRQLLPNAAPEEVIETKLLTKVPQAHKDVQTEPLTNEEKPTVTHQLVQTDVQTSEVATSPFVVRSAERKRVQLENKLKKAPEQEVLVKSKQKAQLEEERNEGDILLELLDETDCNTHDRGSSKRESFSHEDIDEQTSYYELSDSQLAENEVEEAESPQDVEAFAYDDEQEVAAVEVEQQSKSEKEEYGQLIYTAATDGVDQVVDYNFTIYDIGNGEPQVVPKFHNTRSSLAERPNSSQSHVSPIEKAPTVKCPACDITFVSSKTLRRHLIKKHNWDLDDIDLLEPQSRSQPRSLLAKGQKQEEFTTADLSMEDQETLLQELQDEVEREKKASDGEKAKNTSKEQASADEEYEIIDSDSGAQGDSDVVKWSYSCDRCNAGFARIKSLNFHQKLNACTARTYKCDDCERVFISQKLLQEHKETHAYSHACTDCNKMYGSADELSNHMVLDHNRNLRNQCHICKKVFTMLSTLRDHMRTHSGEKPFVCPLCGKGFSQNANLKQHVMRHSKEKKHKCDQCDSSFVTKAEMRCHQRIHTGDTPYKCEFCEALFTTSSSLLKHRRKHTGERPYACDICPMRFSSLNVLKNHRRTHTGEKPYKCTFCGKAFTQKGDCQIHQRIHTGERQYSCYCGRKFTHLGTLRTHMKVHDKEDNPEAKKKLGEKEQGVHITILNMKGGSAVDAEQHDLNTAAEQDNSEIAEDELIQMNIEMC